jgi:hypothetical protein
MSGDHGELGHTRSVRLTEAFRRFLRDRSDKAARGALVEALEAGGHRLEARLIAHWDGGLLATDIDLEGVAWSGRRAWVGPVLPDAPAAGDVWLDVCELTPMLLLPRQPPEDPSEYAPGVLERLTPFVAWLSLRPVGRWQVAAFMAEARFAPRRVQIAPPVRVLDPERLLAGDEAGPVTRILPDEAGLYASWFGKGLSSREAWQAAQAALTSEELVALWGPLRREWAGSVVEGVSSIVTPETADLDIRDAYDEDLGFSGPQRIFYGEFEAPADVGLRTHVNTQVGLRGGGTDPLAILDVQLLDAVDRG